jgi:2-oxoglutarate ferredoxin oxidoreductase subunit delta
MPLDAGEHKAPVGKVTILDYRCKGCGYCIEFCPRGLLAESADFNEKGYHPPYVTAEGKCVSCDFCATICPEFAIFCVQEEGRSVEPGDVLGDPKPRRRRTRHAE